MTPDLSYYWEGGCEWCEENKWEEKRNVGGSGIRRTRQLALGRKSN